VFSCAGAVSSSSVRCSMDPKVLITIFLCGDVMIGRGIDQILPHFTSKTGVTAIADSLSAVVTPIGNSGSPALSVIWGR
jgi:hypothetical protein